MPKEKKGSAESFTGQNLSSPHRRRKKAADLLNITGGRRKERFTFLPKGEKGSAKFLRLIMVRDGI